MKTIYMAALLCVALISLTIMASCDNISSPEPSISSTLYPFDDIEADQVNIDSITQPFIGLEEKLRANEAATFGGLYDQGPQWVIYFTANGDQTIRKYIHAENLFQVKIRESKFTIVQFETTQQNTSKVLLAGGINTSSYIDLLMQRVMFYVKSNDVVKATSLKNDPANSIPYYVDIIDIVQKPAPEPWLQ
jgi:hypothetical protein